MLDSLEYLKLNKFQRMLYKIAEFFMNLPKWFAIKFKKLGLAIKNFGINIAENAKEIWFT